jgi:capsular polysaccharide biosynthesis protein
MKFRPINEVLWSHRWFVGFVLVAALLCSPILIKLVRPTFEGTAVVALVQDDAGKAPAFSSQDVPQLVTSFDVVNHVRQQLHLDEPVDVLRSKIMTKGAPKSSLVPITFRDKDEDHALEVPNALADATVAQYQRLAGLQYGRLISSLRTQMDQQSETIQAVDAKLQAAIQADSFAGSDKALDTISARLDDLQSQRAAAYATLVADRATAASQADEGDLSKVIGEQAMASDPVYQALRQNQAKDDAQYQTERAGYTDTYPGLAGLAEKVRLEAASADAAQKRAVRDHAGASQALATVLIAQRQANAQVAGDSARVAAIDRSIGDTDRRLRDLPKIGVNADALRMRRDSAAAAYQQLAIRLQNTLADQAEAASLSSLLVVDRATSASTRLPALALAAILSCLILGLAVGSAYAIEALDPRIRTSNDVERIYGTPHVGSVGP